jgi:hypothetical protein
MVAAAAAMVALDCGRSHDLGITGSTSSSSSSSASAGGAGGAGGASPTTASNGGAGGSSTSGGGGMGPSGPTRLTVVNGINDYPGALFCFLPTETPWPSSGGLRFAAGQAVDLATAIPSSGDVQVWVIAGDLASVAGATCTQLLAIAQPTGTPDGGTGDGGVGGGGAGVGGAGGGGTGGGTSDGGPSDGGPSDGGVAPRPVVAAAIGVIPPSVLMSDRSLLLVATGCMGGAGHDAPNAAIACGMGYTSTTPTTGVVLLGMSRITDPARVGLQVVNASAVLPTSDVGVVPNLNAAPEVLVAPSLGPGAIGPSPPFAGLAVSAFGPLAGVQINTYPPGSMSVQSSATLGSVLSASTVGASGFVDGAGLVLVAVGSAPGQSAGPFWHALTFALVKADPG